MARGALHDAKDLTAAAPTAATLVPAAAAVAL